MHLYTRKYFTNSQGSQPPRYDVRLLGFESIFLEVTYFQLLLSQTMTNWY